MWLPRFFPADKLLLSIANFLCALGVLILYSTDLDGGTSRGMQQAMYYGVGIVVMLGCILLVRYVRRWSFLIYVVMGGAVLLLATAPKSNSVVMSIDAAIADVRAGKAGPIPRELQNVHADGTGFEREQGYKYPHSYPGHWVQQQYLPDELKGKHYYEYGDNKTEQAARAYWQRIKGE